MQARRHCSRSLVRTPTFLCRARLNPMHRYVFSGSQVSVFGRVEPARNGSQQPLSLYSVGSQNLQAFVAPDVATVQDNVVFFNSSIMPYDQYTLIINVSRASANAPYFLDYIRFNTTNPNTSVTPSNLTSSVISTSSTTSSPSGSRSSSVKSTSTSVGAIVGGVIGGVVAIAAAILAFFCYRHRKRGSRTPIGQSIDDKHGASFKLVDPRNHLSCLPASISLSHSHHTLRCPFDRRFAESFRK